MTLELTREDIDDRRTKLAACLVTLATFALAIGIADRVLSFSGTGRALEAESLYLAKTKEIENGPGTDVLFTGDSRILHGIDPSIVERVVERETGRRISAYDAALSGAPPMAQLATVLRALERPKKPRVVVLGVSPYMFSSRIARDLSRESLHTVYRIHDVGSIVRAGGTVDDVAEVASSRLFFAVRHRPRLLEVLLDRASSGGPASTGRNGFLPLDAVPPSLQAARASSRAEGYRTELLPPAKFGNEQVGYFLETLALLRRKGIHTIVLGTFSASAIDAVYGPESLFRQHQRFVAGAAASYGATFVDLHDTPALIDADFVDGDHLSSEGAARVTAFFTHHALSPLFRRTPAREHCRSVFDFEAPEGIGALTVVGLPLAGVVVEATPRPAFPVFGYHGNRFLTTAVRDSVDGPRGDVTTGEFVLDRDLVRLRVGGGSLEEVRVEVLDGDRVLAIARGRNDEGMREVTLPLPDHRGSRLRLRVVDASSAPWGHLHVDDVRVCNP